MIAVITAQTIAPDNADSHGGLRVHDLAAVPRRCSAVMAVPATAAAGSAATQSPGDPIDVVMMYRAVPNWPQGSAGNESGRPFSSNSPNTGPISPVAA